MRKVEITNMKVLWENKQCNLRVFFLSFLCLLHIPFLEKSDGIPTNMISIGGKTNLVVSLLSGNGRWQPMVCDPAIVHTYWLAAITLLGRIMTETGRIFALMNLPSTKSQQSTNIPKKEQNHPLVCWHWLLGGYDRAMRNRCHNGWTEQGSNLGEGEL